MALTEICKSIQSEVKKRSVLELVNPAYVSSSLDKMIAQPFLVLLLISGFPAELLPEPARDQESGC